MTDLYVGARAITCPACGALVAKGDDSCAYCGAILLGVVGELEVSTPQMAQAVAAGLSYYDILHILPTATHAQVDAAYQLLLDRYSSAMPAMLKEATRQIDLIRQAYEVLSDPPRRQAYDVALELGIRYAPDTPADQPGVQGPEALAHGKGLLTLKMYEQASLVLQKACRLMPESAEAHYLYGVSCLEQAARENIFGIAGSACHTIIREMETAQALDPGLVQAAAYRDLARAIDLKDHGQDSEARQLLVGAIRRKPDWVLTYHVLAGWSFQAEEFDLAEKACKQALALEPANRDVAFILANVYRRTGRGNLAQELEHQIERGVANDGTD